MFFSFSVCCVRHSWNNCFCSQNKELWCFPMLMLAMFVLRYLKIKKSLALDLDRASLCWSFSCVYSWLWQILVFSTSALVLMMVMTMILWLTTIYYPCHCQCVVQHKTSLQCTAVQCGFNFSTSFCFILSNTFSCGNRHCKSIHHFCSGCKAVMSWCSFLCVWVGLLTNSCMAFHKICSLGILDFGVILQKSGNVTGLVMLC